MSHMTTSVNTMQIQFVALLQRIDTMNNRVGALEVGRPDLVEKPKSLVAPSHPPEKEDGAGK